MEKKQTNPTLAKVLDILGLIEVVAFPVLLIAIIWSDDTTILQKLVWSDVIAFCGTFVVYIMTRHDIPEGKN